MYFSDEELDQLLELAGKATPGPWKTGNRGVIDESGHEICRYAPGEDNRSLIEQAYRNGDYIAALNPETLHCLVEDLKFERQENEKLDALIKANGFNLA